MDSDATKRDTLFRLHDEVDAAAARIAARHGPRLRCGRGCHDCCVDGITVFEVEAARIRAAHAELLRKGSPRPPGACAFLDQDGSCRIYDDRPYVCRTQGLPLRWLDTDEDGRTVEFRDICPLNDPGEPPVEEIPPGECWTIGPFEKRLSLVQTGHVDGEPNRVSLRSLFRADDPAANKLPT